MKIRAWVLDDDDGVRSLVSTILDMRGYDTEAYADPKSCLKRLRHNTGKEWAAVHCDDVIISDVHMPGMTGFEFLENNSIRGYEKQNIALMSGEWTKPQLRKARKLGYHVFKKPFNIKEVNHWLDEVEQRIHHG